MFNTFSNFLIFLTGAFSFILASGYIALKNKKQIHYIISALYFSIGFITLHFGFETTNLLKSIPHFINLNIPFIFMMGPLIFIYFRLLLNPLYSIKIKIVLIHMIPSLFAFLMMIPYYFSSGKEKILLYTVPQSLDFIISKYLYILGVTSILIYSIIVLIINIGNFTFKKIFSRGPVLYLVIVGCEMIVLFISMLSSQIFQQLTHWRINYIFAFQIILTIYILGQRYPQFLQSVSKEASKSRYDKSQVKGIDTEAIIKRLNELMTIEKLFTDFDISLVTVSEKLNLTTHQLSEIINKSLNTSFKAFINAFRLREAQKLLLDFPDHTILRIAYDSGFGSKSSFNTFFQKETGMTPSQYRKK